MTLLKVLDFVLFVLLSLFVAVGPDWLTVQHVLQFKTLQTGWTGQI